MDSNKVQIGNVAVEMKIRGNCMWFYCSGASKAVGCWNMSSKEWVKVKNQFHAPFTDKVLAAFNVEK